MSFKSAKLSRTLAVVAGKWAVDPFRPHLQLSAFLRALSAHPRLTESAVTATESLYNNTLMKKYPLSPMMLRPASVPKYYDRMLEGFEKSQQGIAYPLYKRFFKL